MSVRGMTDDMRNKLMADANVVETRLQIGEVLNQLNLTDHQRDVVMRLSGRLAGFSFACGLEYAATMINKRL